jgi:hypothetical protein
LIIARTCFGVIEPVILLTNFGNGEPSLKMISWTRAGRVRHQPRLQIALHGKGVLNTIANRFFVMKSLVTQRPRRRQMLPVFASIAKRTKPSATIGAIFRTIFFLRR